MKRKEKSGKSKSFKSWILSFFSKEKPAPKGNNFDLWDDDQPSSKTLDEESRQKKN